VLTSAVPILPARDMDEAVAFYGRLGFRLVGRHPDYALLKRESAELHLWLCDDRHLAENTACYLSSTLANSRKKTWNINSLAQTDPHNLSH